MDIHHLGPSRVVLEEFGSCLDLEKLPGGQGTAWRCGPLIFKPLDMPEEALGWLDTIAQRSLPGRGQASGLRVSFPQRALSGKLIVEGWTAFTILEGVHLEQRWLDIIEAGYDFSDMLSALECPSFIMNRHDSWAIADRAAWGEQTVDGLLSVPHMACLFSAMRPVFGHAQLIHGDLTGNVLFHPTLPPAIIDLTFYWRPKAYAAAIVVVDALCFEMADESLVGSADERYTLDQDDFAQYLLRALVFRIATDFLRGDHEKLGGCEDPYAETVKMVCSHVIRRSGR